MTEQIKDVIENLTAYVEFGCYNDETIDDDIKVAIRFLNAWEEVLQELEHDKEICFAHDSDEGFVYARAIDIIKSKLEGVTE